MAERPMRLAFAAIRATGGPLAVFSTWKPAPLVAERSFGSTWECILAPFLAPQVFPAGLFVFFEIC